MADDTYDARREKLVMETRTEFATALSTLSAEDKRWLSAAVHDSPQLASSIAYERSHTGFVRVITVTVADLERVYQQRAAAK